MTQAGSQETAGEVGLRGARSGAWDRVRGVFAFVVLTAGVLGVYCPRDMLRGDRTFVGGDYFDLHQHRIHFAQQALFGEEHRLPAWYPRELLGTPFWSNVQSFPFIPTRLAILAFERYLVLPIGVDIAAVLAAWFTYLYCRKIGLARPAAVAAGWTFACSGYFASRVMVGHLPLLEAYPALPLLLWLIESILQAPEDKRFGLRLAGLAVGAACAMLAGHPQLSVYSLEAAGLYILYRGANHKGFMAAGAMAVGLGLASFALWPMMELIGRSTRILALDEPGNNIFFPYWRLGTFLFPWKDGWVPPVDRGIPLRLFAGPTPGYSYAYFWDTICYVGWMPLIAAVALGMRAVRRRKMAAPWPFFIVVGVLALLLALPAMQYVLSKIPGTILRSPARQVYLTIFALALGLGAGIDLLWRSRVLGWRLPMWILAFACMGVQGWDLWKHDRYFIFPVAITEPPPASMVESLRKIVGDGRVAIDVEDYGPANREVDDIGFFDSIMLAKPYRALLELSGQRPGLNVQKFSGPECNARALAYAGVRLVITTEPRPDLAEVSPAEAAKMGLPPVAEMCTRWNAKVYRVPNTAPRAAFFPVSRVSFLAVEEMHKRLADPGADVQNGLMLPAEYRPAGVLRNEGQSGTVEYRRPSSDKIRLSVNAGEAGYVRVIEAWDPGWSAMVDGQARPVVVADDCVMAVAAPAGAHEIVLTYSTPGARTGALMSGISLLVLGGFVVWQRRQCISAATVPMAGR